MRTAVGYPESIRAFQLMLSVEGLRPHTIHNYVSCVKRFADACTAGSPSSVTPTHIRMHVAALLGHNAPKTVHEVQLGLRRFFRFLLAEGEIRSDPTKDTKLVRYTVTPQPTYSESEVRQLLQACNGKTREGVRDQAMVMVLFDTGVREGELLSMTLPDWQHRLVGVTGKTGARQVFLGSAALQSTERYVRRWGITDGPLWRGKKGPLSGSGVLQMIRRLCKRAGVEDKGVHAFRRAAAAQMKRLGMNDSDILEVMGWKDVTMLRRYTAAVAGELAQAAHRIYSPSDGLISRR